MAAGTATLTEIAHTSAKKVVWTWTSGTGAEGGTVTKGTSWTFDGKLVGFTTIPGSAGEQPSAAYDITITDAQGHDVLLGAGANRSNAAAESVAEASLGAVAGSKLTLNITNAGDAKTGVVVLFIR